MSEKTRRRPDRKSMPPKPIGLWPKPAVPEREERILRAATIHLIRKHGMFLVATGLREARIKGFRGWIITVTLRYTTDGSEPTASSDFYSGAIPITRTTTLTAKAFKSGFPDSNTATDYHPNPDPNCDSIAHPS